MGERQPAIVPEELTDEDALAALLNGGDDHLDEARAASQERQLGRDKTIEILTEYYGGQQFYWDPHVGTFLDIVSKCPAIDAVISQGPEAVKGFLAGYEVTDEQAEAIRNPKSDEAKSEEDDEQDDSADTNKSDEIAKLAAEAKSIDRRVQQASRDTTKDVVKQTEREDEPKKDSTPLPVRKSSKQKSDVELVEATALTDERKVSSPDHYHKASESAKTTRSHLDSPINAVTKAVADESIKQVSNETNHRPPEAHTMRADREVVTLEKREKDMTAPEIETTPLPLLELSDSEVWPKERAAAYDDEKDDMYSTREEIEDIDAFQTPQLHESNDGDDLLHAIDQADERLLEPGSELYDAGQTELAISDVDTQIVEVASHPSILESVVESLQDSEELADDSESEAIALDEVTDTVQVFVESYPDIAPIETRETLHLYTKNIAQIINQLEHATTAEQCREQVEALGIELARLLTALGYADGERIAKNLISRYDTKTLKQFIGMLMKATVRRESVSGIGLHGRHRHHKFGQRVVGMLVHSVPMHRQFQAA